MSTALSHPQTLADYLAACGWQHEPASGSWRRATDRGSALLRPLDARSGWQQFELQSGYLPTPEAGGLLAANQRLYGPAKFVGGRSRPLLCRVDLPAELPDRADPASAGFDPSMFSDPVRAWAEAVTVCATGQRAAGRVPMRLDESHVARFERDGYSASFDDDELHIHVHLPGLFREIAIREEPGLGAIVTAELLDLSGLPDGCREAAFYFAEAANDRLGLVRLAVAEEPAPGILRAMVHVGWATIPGAWLHAALEAVEAAVTLTARELAALRDRELAELVLAAAAV